MRPYEVTVAPGGAGGTLEQAMREALVRATGRRDAASDPALAPLVQDAQRYVRSVRSLPDGRTQVTFDGAALESELASKGRSVWGAERPFTLVVLSPPLSGAAADAARRSLEELAETRGLPISLVPMPLTDAEGHELGNDALLANAQALGADDVLIGRGDAAAPNGPWQWTLLTGFSRESFNGGFETAIDGAADALARVEAGNAPLAEAEALVEVKGVTTLADYAMLERTFSELPGVRHAGLEEAEGATTVFRVRIRGGADAVSRALMSSPHLTSAGAGNGRLSYEFRP